MAEVKKKGLFSTFKLVGVPVINKDREKFYKKETSEAKKFTYGKLQFGVKTSDTNTIFVEAMGGYFENGSSLIKTKDKDGNKLEIAWKDRFNKDIVDSIPDYAKTRVELIKDNKHEFIADYDFVEEIQKSLTADMRVVAEGNIVVEKYLDKQGKSQTITKYILKRIRFAYENEKNGATGVCHFVFGNECWDDGAISTDKKIYVNGYITTYDKNLKENLFIGKTFVINAENRDKDPELFDKLVSYYKNTLKSKEGEYMETKWEVAILRGAEEVEISMDDLTDSQRMQIELGIATKEQIIKDKKGGMIGNKVDEIRLVRPQTVFEGEATQLTGYIDEDFVVREHSAEDINKVLGEDTPPDEPTPEDNAVLGLFG